MQYLQIVKMNVVTILVCLFICVLELDSMALKGSPLVRYDPCGLGVVHFDKITEKYWQGTVHLRLYANLKDVVTIGVVFEKNTTVKAAAMDTGSFSMDMKDWNSYEFRINGTIPPKFAFFILFDYNETSVPIVTNFSLNGFVMCDDAIKASQTADSFNVSKSDVNFRQLCGRRSIRHAELTTVLSESQAGDWPWHVAIMIRDDAPSNVTRYQCGGNIISRTAIVTAGHCVKKFGKLLDPQRIVIIAGVNNIRDISSQIGRQIHNAVDVVLHPNYSDLEATADLAVIKVNKLMFNEYVQPVCIWGPVYDKANLFGYHATVVGFGTKEDDQPAEILRSAYTLVQNDTTCINYDRNLYSPLLNEFTFCAGYGPLVEHNNPRYTHFDFTTYELIEAFLGINPRNGDSGGGLTVPVMQHDHKVSWFLRGVLSKCGVSKGQILCDPRFYTVYTDVGPHYGWLYHHSGLKFSSNVIY